MKKLIAVVMACSMIVGALTLTGCELDQEDLDRANAVGDAIGDGIDKLTEGFNGLINGNSSNG